MPAEVDVGVMKRDAEWTPAEWAAWIRREARRREEVFRTDPDELVASYNREVRQTDDYRGRELLELLQNADDAGEGLAGPCRALVAVSEDGLLVANSGAPFSTEGVKSLMVSDNSPKQLARSRYIGHKGLGFRAILGWTDAPFVASGGLRVGFDRERARRQLAAWIESDTGLRRKVQQFAAAGLPDPIAALALPEPLEALPGELGRIAETVVERRFTTVIGIPFLRGRSADVLREIEAQLEHIGRDALLFTRHLSHLRVESRSGAREWTVERGDCDLLIAEHGADPEHWQIHRATGEVPVALCDVRERTARSWDIALALPRGVQPTSPVLYSYFPTKVSFPFPVVAHATLDLTSNRKALVENGANRHVLECLADEMVAAAAALPSDGDPWSALDLLAPRGDLDPTLIELGFKKRLLETMQATPLVPVRAGTAVRPGEARRLSFRERGNLPNDGFKDVMLDLPSDVEDTRLRTLVDALQVPPLAPATLSARLDALSPQLDVQTRARLIGALVEQDAMPSPTPTLLIDAQGSVIERGAVVFLPPSEELAWAPPHWFTFRVLDVDLARELRLAFGLTAVRDLRIKLTAFGVREYALEQLAQAVAASVDARLKAEESDERRLLALREAVQALAAIHRAAVAASGGVGTLDRTIPLPTRAGGIAPASSLYLGRAVGGWVTDALYGDRYPQKLVADPEALGLEGSPETAAFLKWLGVADRPRVISLRDVPADFHAHLLDSVSYPARFGEHRIDSRGDLEEQNPRAVVSTIDGLDDLLAGADPHALLAWVATDPRVEEWRSAGHKDDLLEIWPYRARYGRALEDQQIPSYVAYRLATTPWLPTNANERRAPAECTLDPGLGQDVRAVLPRPQVDARHPLLKSVGIDDRKLRGTLERAGVRPSLAELSWDDFYDLLLSLPDRDSEGRRARAIYRALADRRGSEESPPPEVCDHFRARGRLWGRHGDVEGWFRVDELRYDDNAVIPDALRRELKLFAFDRRRGAQKTRRLFGVEPLDASTLQIAMAAHEPSPLATILEAEVEELKPYVLALRPDDDSVAARLRRLRIDLCASGAGAASLGGVEVPFELLPGDAVSVGDVVYLVGAAAEVPVLRDELLADAVGDALAYSLGLRAEAIPASIARLASCTPARRVRLLARLEGIAEPAARERVETARTQLRQEPVDEHVVNDPPLIVPPAPPPASPTAAQAADAPNGHTTNGSANPPGPEAAGPRPTSVSATPSATPAPRVSGPVALRVQRRATAAPGRPSIPRVTDGGLCEHVALLFEQSPGQNRFPRAVGHVTGSEGFGCDILSFDCEANRRRFDETGDRCLIDRFIEVKGRSNESAAIQLGGNESTSALRELSRYYVYRLYEFEPGAYELRIIRNPATGCEIVLEVGFRDADCYSLQTSAEP